MPWPWNESKNAGKSALAPTFAITKNIAKAFSMTQARDLLDGLPGGGLNIAHEAVVRHVLGGKGGKLALRWIGRDRRGRDFTYTELCAAGNRCPNVLAQRGVGKGAKGRSPRPLSPNCTSQRLAR